MLTEYRKKISTWAEPWTKDIDMTNVSVSKADKEQGSPKEGDMIATNPANEFDRWLIAEQYFKDNYEPVAQDMDQVLFILNLGIDISDILMEFTQKGVKFIYYPRPHKMRKQLTMFNNSDATLLLSIGSLEREKGRFHIKKKGHNRSNPIDTEQIISMYGKPLI